MPDWGDLPVTNAAFVYEVMAYLSENDMQEVLSWNANNGEIEFYANVNDVFFWACADAEDVTPENFAELKKAIADIRLAAPGTFMEHDYGVELFAARNRGMRPQGAAYPPKDSGLVPLFDAAGPFRETGTGNPCPDQESYKERFCRSNEMR